MKAHAGGLGFAVAGIASADDLRETEREMVARSEAGMLAEMVWFTQERARLACRPRARFPWARSIIALAVPYYRPHPAQLQTVPIHLGSIARYAWGEDYHIAVTKRLASLAAFIRSQRQDALVQPYVDTSPVAERAIAVRAGLGWFGKNANLLTSGFGSWVFLAGLITNLDLPPDVPLKKSCGSCAKCLDACPSGALVAPYVVDSRRCLSYLTIELRSSIPHPLRPLLDNRVFGCDVCQEVCPVNARAPLPEAALFPPPDPDSVALELAPLLALTDEEFRRIFRGTAMLRAKRAGLQRNVAVALGNAGDPRAVPALARSLQTGDPLVREHSAWALGRISGRRARNALTSAALAEPVASVRAEIACALEG